MKTFKQMFNEARDRRIREQRDYLKSHPKHVHKPFKRAGGLRQVTSGDQILRVPLEILEFWECRCGLGYVKRGKRFQQIPESQLHRIK
jgi:hypothetical protein